MKRRNIVAAGGALAASVAGCLDSDDGGDGDSDANDDSDGDGSSSDPTASPVAVVEQFYTGLDENPDPQRVDELFHSESPTADTWAQTFEATSPGDGADVVDTTARVRIEDPSESDLDTEIGFAVNEETFQTIVDIVDGAADSAIVEIDVELEENGERTEETDLWVVATEDGEWRIVW